MKQGVMMTFSCRRPLRLYTATHKVFGIAVQSLSLLLPRLNRANVVGIHADDPVAVVQVVAAH
jgi:hypothetical protein